MTLKERVENNPVVWLLGALLTGFGAGIATYEGILRIAHLEVVSTTGSQAQDGSSDEEQTGEGGTSLTPGYFVLLKDLNVAAKLDADRNYDRKNKSTRIWFSYPRNPLGTITDINKSDPSVVSIVEYWIEPLAPRSIVLGELGTFVVVVSEHRFNEDHTSLLSVQLVVRKDGS